MQETFRELVNLVATKAGHALPSEIKRLINDRYRQVVDRRTWSWLQKEGVFQTVAEYETGTVDVVLGSTTVSIATGVFTSAMAGRMFRVGTNSDWYTILTVDSASQVTLDVGYENSTASAAGFSIRQNRFQLANDLKILKSLTVPRTLRQLQPVQQNWFDGVFAARQQAGDPIYFAYTRSVGTTEEVELYPVPDRVLTIKYRYQSGFTQLVNDVDTLLADVRADVIVNGALADAFRLSDKPDLNKAREFEALFERGLREMEMRDVREARPGRVKLAPQYTQHRRLRGTDPLDLWQPWIENPYD